MPSARWAATRLTRKLINTKRLAIIKACKFLQAFYSFYSSTLMYMPSKVVKAPKQLKVL